MSTVDKQMADKIAALKGQYEDDEQIIRIVEYDNNWGGQGYGLEYARTKGRYAASDFVRKPRIYWELATTGSAA